MKLICTCVDMVSMTGRGYFTDVQADFADFADFGSMENLGALDAVAAIPAGSTVERDVLGEGRTKSVHVEFVLRGRA